MGYTLAAIFEEEEAKVTKLTQKIMILLKALKSQGSMQNEKALFSHINEFFSRFVYWFTDLLFEEPPHTLLQYQVQP